MVRELQKGVKLNLSMITPQTLTKEPQKSPSSVRPARNKRLITAGGGNFDEEQRQTALRQVEWWIQAHVLSGICAPSQFFEEGKQCLQPKGKQI